MALVDYTVDNIIELNMIPGTRPPRLHCSRYDNGRQITIEIYNGDDPFDVSEYYCTIEGSGDIAGFTYSVIRDLQGVITTNTIKCNIIGGMTKFSGNIPCELVLYKTDGGIRVGSLNFILEVEESPIKDSYTDPSSDFASLVTQVTEALQQMKEINLKYDEINNKYTEILTKLVEYHLDGTSLYITAQPSTF